MQQITFRDKYCSVKLEGEISPLKPDYINFKIHIEYAQPYNWEDITSKLFLEKIRLYGEYPTQIDPSIYFRPGDDFYFSSYDTIVIPERKEGIRSEYFEQEYEVEDITLIVTSYIKRLLTYNAVLKSLEA